MMSSKCVINCDGLPQIIPDCNLHQVPPSAMASMRSAIEASPNPSPYTFRIPAPAPRKGGCGGAQHAKAPPFYMLLDHTLAVLWCLFRKKANKSLGEECEMGVGQLQWALYFLKGIKPPNGGDRAEDVSIAIQVVQDALLDLYADMSNVVMQSPTTMSTSMGTGSQPSCTRCEAFKRGYTGNMSWMPDPPVSSCNKCSSVTLGANKAGGRPRRTGRKEESSDASKTTLSLKTSPTKPPKPVPHLKDEALEQEIIELKKVAAELAKKAPDADEKSEFSMLAEWHKDQVNRVKNEIRRLKSLQQTLGGMGLKDDDFSVKETMDSSFNPGYNSTFQGAK